MERICLVVAGELELVEERPEEVFLRGEVTRVEGYGGEGEFLHTLRLDGSTDVLKHRFANKKLQRFVMSCDGP